MRNSIATASLSLFLATAFVTAARSRAQEPMSDMRAPVREAAITSAAQIHDALSSLQTLLEQTRKSGDRKAEANLLGAIANSYQALHQQQRAVEQFQAARSIWHEIGDNLHEATTVAHIGDVYRGWGFPEQANRYYREALASYPADDKSGRGATLNNLGLTYFSLNNRRKCLESLEQALAIFRQLQDRHGEGLALANLGAANLYLVSDPLKAIGILQEAITKLDVINDRVSEAGALDQMGVAWHMLGKSEMAGLNFERSLLLFHEAGDVHGEAAVRKHMRTLGQQQTQASSK